MLRTPVIFVAFHWVEAYRNPLQAANPAAVSEESVSLPTIEPPQWYACQLFLLPLVFMSPRSIEGFARFCC